MLYNAIKISYFLLLFLYLEQHVNYGMHIQNTINNAITFDMLYN